MSEAELHVLRARLEGGIRNKAARGELRQALPVGLVWGEDDGEILLDPDEAVRGAIATIFERFAELGSVAPGVAVDAPRGRAVPAAPLRARRDPSGSSRPTTRSTACSRAPSTPARTRSGRPAASATSTSTASTRQRMRRLPQAEWEVLIWEHHPGFIDKATFEANRERIARNTRPRAHEPGGAVREGAALLQGIAVCGRCGRKLKVHYQGRRGHQSPAYHCPGSILVENRGQLVPAGRRRPDRPGGRRRAARRAHPRRRQGRAARGRGARARPRRRARSSGGCRSSAPDTRPSGPSAATARSSPSTGSSPAAWSATGSTRSARSPRPRPSSRCASSNARARSPTHEREQLLGARRRPRPRLVGADHHRPRPQAAAALPDRGSDRRRRRASSAARRVTIRWRGGAITELAVPLPQPPAHDPHRRGHDRAARAGSPPTTTTPRSPGSSTAKAAAPPPASGSPRSSSAACAATASIPAYQPPAEPPDGELLPVGKAADELGVAASTMLPLARTTGSSPASRTPPARPGGSASTTSSARCSSKTRPPATSRSSTRCGSSASPARPCCSVSSAASCKPSTSATDAEKACEYWSHTPKPACSTPPP